MTQEQIVAFLQANYFGSHWNLRGNLYENLEWLDDPATKPTAEEIGLA